MKTDALLYRLLQDHPDLVFELAGLPHPTVPYQLRAEEVKETQFRLDGVLLPPVVTADAPLVFLENQFWPDDDFYARWFASIFLYLRQHPEQRWWRAVALYPERRTDTGQTRGFEELLAGRVTRVYLDELVAALPESPALGLIQLLLAEPDRAILKAREMLAVQIPSWPDMHAWVETVLIYKLPRLTREEIRKMVHLIDVDLKDTGFYRSVFAEGADFGRQEGRLQGEADLLLRQLRRRVGGLNAEQEAMIRRLSEDRLHALGEALLDFSGPEDFARWLAQNIPH
jgi:predicted transposase/invertase (TIGR01784 family)